jgi:hypothetical protein
MPQSNSRRGLGPAIVRIGAMPCRLYVNDGGKNFENTGSPLPVGRDTGPDVGSRQMNTLTQLRYRQMDTYVFVHTPFANPKMNLSPLSLSNLRYPNDEVVPSATIMPVNPAGGAS